MILLLIEITTSPGIILASSAAEVSTTPVIIMFFGVLTSKLLSLINSSVTSVNSIPIQGLCLDSAHKVLKFSKEIKKKKTKKLFQVYPMCHLDHNRMLWHLFFYLHQYLKMLCQDYHYYHHP